MFKRKIKWNEGVSEIISFALIVPFIIVLLSVIMSATHISAVKQKLAYSAYSVGRAAVVCEDRDFALARTDALMDELYGDKYIDGGFNMSLGHNHKDGDTFYKLELIGEGTRWEKGSMLKCTVYQYVNPVMPFTRGFHSESIVMMIENFNPDESIIDSVD